MTSLYFLVFFFNKKNFFYFAHCVFLMITIFFKSIKFKKVDFWRAPQQGIRKMLKG